MENGVVQEDCRSVKMGATGSPNAARLTELQEKKKSIEEKLASCNKELRQLCIQEAELTGIMPPEIPLEPGESAPTFRRRVGTAYQLPQNLLNSLNNKDELITALEIEKQLQASLAEAALGLANEPNMSKTMRRQHKGEYQYHRQQYNMLEDKLLLLKSQNQLSVQESASVNQQQKHKKKPRPPDQEDAVSIGSEQFSKSILRHSMRSLQHPSTSDTNLEQQRYSTDPQRLAYMSSENSLAEVSPVFVKSDDILANGVYRLSINGYNSYMERREGASNNHIPAQYPHSQSTSNVYQHHQPASSLTFPQVSRRSPQNMPMQSILYSYNPAPSVYSQTQHDCNKYFSSINTHSLNMSRHSSPSTSGVMHHPKIQYHTSPTHHSQSGYKQYSTTERYRNPSLLQIQPHQQYEQDVMGLGGYWKQTEGGEMVWCNSVPMFEDAWQRDKRFGSLDRRKNKRLHKRTSPLVEAKVSATPAPPTNLEQVKTVSSKPSQVVNRNRQDSRQLVRTQSLGSVGAQTVDGIWPSDENSSCESDAHSIETGANARRPKQKEWYETALDGPSTPTLPRSHSIVSSQQSQQEERSSTYSYSPQLPCIQKPPLEIPAESNPSPRVPETNIEIFNNNIPKNCTVVQAGVCKPYHEETKPFEMSDFYKYSTKFKKSPQKQQPNTEHGNVAHNRSSEVQQVPSNVKHVQRNLADVLDSDNNVAVQKTIYQPLQSMKCQPFTINNASFGSADVSDNLSLDLSQLSTNIAENFSSEMKDWYQTHEKQIDNRGTQGSPSKSRSTATLV